MTRTGGSPAAGGAVAQRYVSGGGAAATFVDEVARSGGGHPGLLLDKLGKYGNNQKEQRPVLDEVVRQSGDQQLLSAWNERHGQALSDLNAQVEVWERTTTGPLTLHLARAAALENAGICLHPILGCCYLPGSGLKGMARAWAETVWAPGRPDVAAAWRQVERVFGWAPGSESVKSKGWRPPELEHPSESCAGAVVFHDALPVAWPTLEVDITNSHHPDYYATGSVPPADTENPVPVYFLAVRRGATFRFALSARAGSGAEEGWIAFARTCLDGALSQLGAGAKTAAGYGVFDAPVDVVAPVARRITVSYDVELVSPAFLAGARQDGTDCELRPATLRGSLRWWWRTMHSGALDVGDLRTLEGELWGSTSTGSPITVRVVPIAVSGSHGPFPFDRAEEVRRHRLEKPKNQRTVMGLHYHSYGMDESGQAGKTRRHYLDAGARYRVVLSARGTTFGAFGDRVVEPGHVLDQAVAALRLLCAYGGVGSKSRKGFGSLGCGELSTLEAVGEARKVARELRERLGLSSDPRSEMPRSASLDRASPVTVPTKWNDPWYALDRIGASAQEFALTQKGKPERLVLGLPRKGLPASVPRMASWVHYHLGRGGDGRLEVRVIAFTMRPPDGSSGIPADSMSRLVRGVSKTLGTMATRPDPGATPGAPRSVATSAAAADEIPASGAMVRGRVTGKTKKGKWELDIDGRKGVVSLGDPTKEPAGVDVGSEVDVYFRSESSGTWMCSWDPGPTKTRPGGHPPRGGDRDGRRGSGRGGGRW